MPGKSLGSNDRKLNRERKQESAGSEPAEGPPVQRATQPPEHEVQAARVQRTTDELPRQTAPCETAVDPHATIEARLRLALEAARTVVWEWDLARDEITSTPNVRDIYGVDSLPDWEAIDTLLHPEDREPYQATVRAAVEGTGDDVTGYRSELRIVRPDTGQTIWVEERGILVRDESGQVAKVIGVATDVTARQASHASVQEREQQFRTLADSIPQLAWIAHADGYIFWYNQRWYTYTGTTPADMTGWGWQSVHDPTELPRVLERWRSSIRTGEPFDMEFPLKGADGRFRWFLTRVMPVKDASGSVVRWFGTNTDIQAQREAAAERERLLALEQSARSEAERANRAKSEFLATMSHELRTPLNAIAGHVQLLQMGLRGPVTEPQHEALARVQRAQRYLLRLINDVLNLTRLETGHVEYDVREVILAEVMTEVGSMIEPQLAAKQLTYDVRLPDPALTVWADREKLQQILLNLLSNAVKFTPVGGRIAVDAAARADRSEPPEVVFLRVSDTGHGIAPDQLERIFEPFVQVDTSHTRTSEGAGLGLAISRDLAHGMGGELRARSTLGKGSTFTLTLRRVVTASGKPTDRRTRRDRRSRERRTGLDRRSGVDRRDDDSPGDSPGDSRGDSMGAGGGTA